MHTYAYIYFIFSCKFLYSDVNISKYFRKRTMLENHFKSAKYFNNISFIKYTTSFCITLKHINFMKGLLDEICCENNSWHCNNTFPSGNYSLNLLDILYGLSLLHEYFTVVLYFENYFCKEGVCIILHSSRIREETIA